MNSRIDHCPKCAGSRTMLAMLEVLGTEPLLIDDQSKGGAQSAPLGSFAAAGHGAQQSG